jgi:hypothetical protein
MLIIKDLYVSKKVKCKNKIMKKTLISLSFIALIMSCDPDIVCTNTCTNKRIRNLETAGNYYKIEYDGSSNKQTAYKFGLNPIAEYTYSNLSATIKAGTINANLVTDDQILPQSEFVTSSSSTGENIGGLATANVDRTYTYDAAGRVLTLIEKQGTLKVTSNYTWVTGNLTKIVTFRNAGTPLTKTTTISYYSDVINSISDEFKGLQIFGKTSYNAPKITTIVATGQPTSTTVAVYRIDDCGCITNAALTTGSSIVSTDYFYEKIPE